MSFMKSMSVANHSPEVLMLVSDRKEHSTFAAFTLPALRTNSPNNNKQPLEFSSMSISFLISSQIFEEL